MSDKENGSTPPKDDKELDTSSFEKTEIGKSLHSINDLPKSLREVAFLFKQSIIRSAAHPLIEKFKDDHIHKALDHLNTANERQYELEKIDKRNNLIAFLIGIGIFVFLTIFLLPKDKDTFLEIINRLVTLLGGIGIGGGYAIYKIIYKNKK